MERKEWRTPFEPTRRTSASNKNASLRNCRKRTARRCWSCAHEKNCSPCWARTRSDRDDPPGTESRRIRRLDQQAVPVVRSAAALCLLPTGEVGAEAAGALCRIDQGDDRGEPVVRIPDGRAPARFQQEHSAADLSAQGLAGSQTSGRVQTAHSGAAVGGAAPERTLGDGHVPSLGRTRQLDDAGAGDRLPYTRSTGLAPVAQRPIEDRGGRARTRADRPIRDARSSARAVPASLGQRPGFHQP